MIEAYVVGNGGITGRGVVELALPCKESEFECEWWERATEPDRAREKEGRMEGVGIVCDDVSGAGVEPAVVPTPFPFIIEVVKGGNAGGRGGGIGTVTETLGKPVISLSGGLSLSSSSSSSSSPSRT